MEYIRKLLNNRVDPPVLSPIGDVTRPGSLIFSCAEGYEKLFSGRVFRRSPGSVRRHGMLDRFLFRSCLCKIRDDASKRFDVSVVLYPMGMDLAAWGIVLDRVGRVFEAYSRTDGYLEFIYQGGCCRSKRDWRILVGTRPPDDEVQMRMFYNRARRLANDRITVAGTVGFGLWDALWMSLDLENARFVLEQEPDFARLVFRYWKEFHLAAAHAMLDAGIKLIFFREHPGGFPVGQDMASRIDPFIREHFEDLCRAVRSRGGSLFLDCDADDMLETDFPMEWGFEGIGPLLFRDKEDLISASTGLNDELFLVGAIPTQQAGRRVNGGVKQNGRLLLAEKPDQIGDVNGGNTHDATEVELTFPATGVYVHS